VTFGALEHGVQWDGHRVCARCAESLESEKQRRAEAEAAVAAQNAQHAEETRHAQEQQNSALARAKKAQSDKLGYAILFGALGIVCLFIPFARHDSDGAGVDVTQGIARSIWLSVLGFLFLCTLFNVWRYRRGSKLLVKNDLDAMRLMPIAGIAGAFVVPIVLAVGLVLIGFLTSVGVGGGILIEDVVKDGSGLAYWVCVPVGFIIGLVCAAGLWDYIAATFCPNCRRYFVTTVLSSEQAGTETRTYEKNERLYMKDPDGRILATTDLPVQRQEVTEKHRVYCRCRNCSHEWAAMKSMAHR
jgi:ribosomal protein L44E